MLLHILIFIFAFTTVFFSVLAIRYNMLYQDSLETIKEMKKEPGKLRIVKGNSSDLYYIKFGHKFMHKSHSEEYRFYPHKTGCAVFCTLETVKTEFEKVVTYFDESYEDVSINHTIKI